MTRRDATTRRALLGGAATLAAAGLVAGALPARAKAPMTNTQAPAFYRFRLGAFEATVVSDGPLHFGPPSDKAFVGLSEAQMRQDLERHFLPTDMVSIEQNALVVNTGSHLVLFDTGLGGVKLMDDDTGRLPANLKAAGIEPDTIDAVAITHAHPDHCFGLMAGTTRNFPNAQIYMAQADFDFWTDESKAVDDATKAMIQGTRAQLLPNRGRIVFVKDGQEFLPGIQAIATPGHTVGHLAFMISSQGRSLCNAGDVVHHHVVSMERPRLPFIFDTDGDTGARSRIRMLDMLAAQRIPMIAYHFPWPGIGHVDKAGDAYRYVPTPMRMVL